MPIICIHNDNADTIAFVATCDGLKGIKYTAVEGDGSTKYVIDREFLKTQIKVIIDELFAMLGMKINRQPKPSNSGIVVADAAAMNRLPPR